MPMATPSPLCALVEGRGATRGGKKRSPWLAPPRRWEVIRSLMADDEKALLRVVHGAGMLSSDTHGSVERALSKRVARAANESDYDFVVDLEQRLFQASKRQRGVYKQGVVRFMHALMHNRRHIVQNYTPAEALRCAPDLLLVNTVTDQLRRQTDMHERRFKEMLHERFEELELSSDNTEGLLQCARCKSTNVVWEQRQTRSADEGMTIIAVCTKCSNTWVMS